MYSSKRSGRIPQLTREQINLDQKAWKEESEATPLVITRVGDMNFQITGLDMGNFRELVGPESYAQYLRSIGEVEIIEPPTGVERALDVAALVVSRVCEVVRR